MTRENVREVVLALAKGVRSKETIIVTIPQAAGPDGEIDALTFQLFVTQRMLKEKKPVNEIVHIATGNVFSCAIACELASDESYLEQFLKNAFKFKNVIIRDICVLD